MPNILWETDLGLIGLVISGLLSLTAYVVWSGNNREDRRVASTNTYYENLQMAHNRERAEWREEASERLRLNKEELSIVRKEVLERQDATNLVLNDLREAIKESNALHKERRING